MRPPPFVTDRKKAAARIQRLVERLHSPRLHMTLIVALTGAAGLLSSFALLHTGVSALWLRYPVAVGVSYVAFLFLLWRWLRSRSAEILDLVDIPTPEPVAGSELPAQHLEPGGGQFGGGGASDAFAESPELIRFSSEPEPGLSGASSSVSDATGALDLEDIGIVLVAVVALIGAAWAALSIIWAAPTLFAELLLDVLLAAGLYRRLRTVRGGRWLRTAIRRTGGPFVAVALLFGLAGAAMQAYAPGARSLGEVISRLHQAR